MDLENEEHFVRIYNLLAHLTWSSKGFDQTIKVLKQIALNKFARGDLTMPLKNYAKNSLSSVFGRSIMGYKMHGINVLI